MRAFIAVEVPDEVKDGVEKLQSELRTRGLLFVKRNAMHITLQFLGEISEDDVEKAKGAMQSVKFTRFKISLSGLSYFSPDFVKVIFAKVVDGSAELQDIYAILCEALVARGIRFEKEQYTPHLTVARVKHMSNRKELLDLINRHSSAELGFFDATSIHLKASTLTPEGPVYKDLYELEL